MTNRPRFALPALALGLLITIAGAAAQQPTAPARTVDVVDHPFGLTQPDPYRR